LRLISPPNPFHPLLPLRPYERRQLEVNLPGVAPKATYTTNKWGLRGEDPPARWADHLTILTIGGSTTHCFYLDDRAQWPHLLQQHLRSGNPQVWVGNGGLDGHSTRGHLIFMKQAAARLRPKVAIFLVGANDLSLSLSESKRRDGNGFDDFDDFRGARIDRAVLKTLFHHSRLVQLLYAWKQIAWGEVQLVKFRGQHPFEPKPVSQAYEPVPSDRLESMLPQLDEYRNNLHSLISLSRASNIRPVFLTQPLLFGDTDYYRGVLASYHWHDQNRHELSAADYWRLLDVYNRTLLEVCRAEQVVCFDLASTIPHERDYFHDALHFTDLGAAKVADELARFLLNRPDFWNELHDQESLHAEH
jgi:lysophospholipase L1-like esterase